MSRMKSSAPGQPQIQFARSSDDTRIAYAITGEGPPLVRAAHWLGNLDFDWQTPVWGPWISALSERYRLLRYDSRGCGLSDREADAITIEGLVADLECVVDKAGLERFALLGASQGGAVSIVYAARHPERVSHLVLCGAFARGALRRSPSPQEVEATEAMIKLVEFGWGQSNPAFLQMFTSQFFPQATLAQAHSFNEIQRHAASPRVAARLIRAFAELDASAELAKVQAPTLVFHSRGDNRVPFEEGRFVATSIPGARFQPLDSNSHVPLPGEPAYQRLLDDLAAFMPASKKGAVAFAELTPREREVLDQIARGRDNAQIAAQLDLAEKTVRNYVTAIFDKIAVENRSQAIVAARVAGLGDS
jgi:pimeloyl-ACP methyl ester carboxylesterase/DNA-binding CsgD family transcriptional regulator